MFLKTVAIAALGAAAIAPAHARPVLDDQERAERRMNGLTTNALSANALSANALSANGVRKNGEGGADAPASLRKLSQQPLGR